MMHINFENTDVGGFNYEFLRVISTLSTGGAELGEALSVAHRIQDNNFESWITEWAAEGDKVAQEAETAQQRGQTVTARRAFIRANNYYRAAIFYAVHDDPRHEQLWARARASFLNAAALMSPPIDAVEIPFDGARLPGYFLKGGEGKRPTLLVLGGFDSTMEELLHWVGFAGVERGWNILAFEGPGQWSALRMNPGLLLRADYEKPVSAVVEYALSRAEVDADKLALIGYSLGGCLVPRAAAFEPRLKACISNGLLVDVGEAWRVAWPKALLSAPNGVFDAAFEVMAHFSPSTRWAFNHASWTMGIHHPSDFFDAWKPHTLQGLTNKIHCPLLALFGEDEIASMSTKIILDTLNFMGSLKTPTTAHVFTRAEGAASHCQMGGMLRAQAVIFDWLDTILIAPQKAITAPALTVDPAMIALLLQYHNSSEVKDELRRLKLLPDLLEIP